MMNYRRITMITMDSFNSEEQQAKLS